MYELFDHTADLGLRIRGDSLKELFEEAARALFSVIVMNLQAVRTVRQLTFEIPGTRRDELLFDWLGELLWTFNAEHVLLCEFEVDVREAGLTATARGEPLDPARHELDAEVKAITYHGLKVETNADGWLAEVIVDI